MSEFSEKCKVLKNDVLGRYVVAAQKISTGEVLLVEGPTLIMPTRSEKRCTNCFRLTQTICRTNVMKHMVESNPEDEFHFIYEFVETMCKVKKRLVDTGIRIITRPVLSEAGKMKCNVFPLCGSCPSHHTFECNFFAQNKNIRSEFLATNIDALNTIKCLLLNENPITKNVFEKFRSLESHQEKRKDTEIWCENTKNIMEPILSSGIVPYLKGTQPINEDLIQHICGVIDVNCFEIRAPDDGSMRAMYLKAALLAHQCVPNTSIAIDSNHQMKIYANCDVKEGDMLTYCYTNPLLGTDERRLSLMIGKYFHCKCPRCEDPTELGSHMSSLICRECPDGAVVHNGTKWGCVKCDFTMETDDVDQLLARAKDDIFLANDDIRKYETLIARFSKIFHQNHYLIFDLKQNVAAILRSFLMNPTCQPGKLVLERKTTLCEDILGVLRIVQPGISRLKAIALYEMFTSYTELNRLRYHQKEINEMDLLEVLKQAEVMLREAVGMLLHEPVNTPEGQLAKNMFKELKDLQNDMKILSK